MNRINFFLAPIIASSSLIFSLVSTTFAATHTDESTAEPVSATDHIFSVPQPLMMGIQHRNYGFAGIENSQAELAMSSTLVKLPLGKFDLLGGAFVPTPSIERTTFRFNDTDTNNQDSYTLKAQLMLIRQVNDAWTSILQVTPSLHSDLVAIDEDAFSLMGLAMWRYKSTVQSSWIMGVGFNRLFGVYKPIPLLAYQYRLAEGMQFDVGFPVTKAEYRWRGDWSAFTSIAPVGGNWRYESDGSSSATPSSSGSDDKERLNLSYKSWVAGLGVRYRLKDQYWATIELGQSFDRKLNLDAEDHGQHDIAIDDTPVLMLSIGLHP
jgi:hypothetical protein